MDPNDDLQHAVARAAARPADVKAQMAAAYANDRLGYETEAIVYYDHAAALGVHGEERPGFLLGYGSTLRNVGRRDEAVTVLRQAVAEYPQDAALAAFLGLALHSTGRHDEAMGTLLGAALAAARPEGFGPYARALREYELELRSAAGNETSGG